MSAAENSIEREARVFAEAAELDASERAAFLDQACGPDQALRARIESLLEADSVADSGLEQPAVAGVRDLIEGSAELPERIGAYRVLGLLGSGGMGLVYEALQDNTERRVALKVVRPGLVTESLLRRFEAEARILGWLEHPGIARIYEAGTARSGATVQPFFAMELVRGVPLTRYADEHGLDTAARLELLARVCDAIQHAHQKGVIHRDLKPANVLVDETGQPKVLDFGVARAMDSDLQATTMQTATGELVGTLSYMSPEQVAGRPDGIDTRSDVYALGVIAHELLSGAPPLDLGGKLIHEAARAILEDEPSTLGALDASLRGDVETIVTKALAKEKERRYASSEELARDIRRFLDDEPIIARPASATYQLRKFARRNRALVVGALVAVLALVVGTAASTFMWLRAEDARRVAVHEQGAADVARAEEQRQKELVQAALERATEAEHEAVLAADHARREAGIATQVKDFVVTLFNAANPLNSRGREVTLGDLLERGAQVIVDDVEQDPRVRAEVMSTIALTYQGMGRAGEALPLMEAAAAVAREIDDPEFVDAKLRILRRLGRLYVDVERLDDALAQLLEAREFAREHFGVDHAMELRVRSNIGLVLLQQGRFEEALEVLAAVDALARARDLDALDAVEGQELHDFVRSNRYYLAGVKSELGDTSGAIGDMQDLVAFYEGRDRPDDPALIPILATLAGELMFAGRLEEARPVAERCLRIAEEQVGEDSLQCVPPQMMLGRLYLQTGELVEAEARFERALELTAANGREMHRDSAFAYMQRADARMELGRFDSALDDLLAALEIQEQVVGRGHQSRQDTIIRVSNLLVLAAREPAPADPGAIRPVDLLLERAAGWFFEHDGAEEADRLLRVVEAETR